jgi:putative transcriptional regulator
MIHHHPDQDLLLAYAAGATDEATSLILATHMDYCAACRAQGRGLEAVGGALLEELPAAALASGALDAALSRLDRVAPYQCPRSVPSRDGAPPALRAYIGGDLSEVRWRRMGTQLRYAPLFRRGPIAARLLRGAPGAESGPHSHAGLEYTLVLRGGFSDVTGSYGPGDLQVMAGDMHHNPIADPGEDCVNLAVTTGRLKFDQMIRKIAAPLFGF